MTIDPNTLNTLTSITLNVASNGLTSLLAFSGHKAKELVVGKDFLEQQELDKTALFPILQQAIQDAAEHAPWNAPKGVEIAMLFLRSPEAEELVRQIYAMGFGSIEKPNDFTFIRTSFVELLKHYADAYQPDLLPDTQQFISAANALFDALSQACNLLLDKAIDKGVLAAHEAKDSFRYNIISSQLIAIQKELELLQSSKEIDVKAILDFEKQYRKQVEYQCSRITPPNLQGARKHPIDSLYVYPTVTMVSNKFFAPAKRQQKEDIYTLAILTYELFTGKSSSLNRDAFFARVHRAVVLGNPGAGKSTMAIKLCYDLAGNKAQRLFAGRQTLTPIFVTLRVYGADKQKSGCSILDFIEGEAKKTFQLSAVPVQAFDYMLQTGRAMVIFDGLDELLDTSYRQIIRDDVELFCQLYPSVPVLITSREVGYEQAALNENLFEVFRLAPFDDKQIDEYVHKWFDIADAESISLTRRQALAENFLKDSKIVPDLCSNPLMLALLCTIYHQEGYIPRYRPDVYEKCAIMLFERWDKSRNIYDPPLPEEHVRPLLEDLAHWIYANTQLRAGITETTLIKKSTSYLHKEIYEDQRKAERVAREFIAFCTGRAWVFIDTGTQKDGENLYQFAHATFLEYFAASHLVRSSSSPSMLLKALTPHIAKREWDVMAQLAFQVYSKQNVGASDKLLIALVERSQTNKREQERFYLLLFAVRCLHFIIPRPGTRRIIASACINLYIILGSNILDKGESQVTKFYVAIPLEDHESYILDNFDNLINENRITIANTIFELISECVSSNNDNKAIIALEIILYLKNIHPDFGEVCNKIFSTYSSRIEQLYPKSLLLCQNQFGIDKLGIRKLVEFHGIKSLFVGSHFIIADHEGIAPIYELLRYSIAEGIKPLFEKTLQDFGIILLSYSPPWLNNTNVFYGSPSNIFKLASSKEVKQLNTDALFGVFCILAIHEGITSTQKRLVFPHSRQIHPIYYLLYARSHPKIKSPDDIQTLLNQCHFTSQQQDFIWRWIRKEISLVAPDETNQDDNQEQP